MRVEIQVLLLLANVLAFGVDLAKDLTENVNNNLSNNLTVDSEKNVNNSNGMSENSGKNLSDEDDSSSEEVQKNDEKNKKEKKQMVLPMKRTTVITFTPLKRTMNTNDDNEKDNQKETDSKNDSDMTDTGVTGFGLSRSLKFSLSNTKKSEKMPFEDFNKILLGSNSMTGDDGKERNDKNEQTESLDVANSQDKSDATKMKELEDELIDEQKMKKFGDKKDATENNDETDAEMIGKIQSKLESFENRLKTLIDKTKKSPEEEKTNSFKFGERSEDKPKKTPEDAQATTFSSDFKLTDIDFHTIHTLTNANAKEKMYDLVKNVESYTDFNLLMAAQLILPKTDSKDFVDRPTKRPIAEIRSDFNRLRKRLGIEDFSKVLKQKATGMTDRVDLSNGLFGLKDGEKQKNPNLLEVNTTKNQQFTSMITSAAAEIAAVANKTKIEMLKKFIDDNFEAPGTDLVEHEPEDWKSYPELLKEKDALGNKITNKNVKEVTIALNNVWKELSRVKVEKKGTDSTLLSLPYPFMVPGGRFREFYYWDTYFILEGLVRSKMYKSAFNIVRNFAHIIKTLGYIPNGTREYYKFRSQPPFFPLMLVKILGINEEMDRFVYTEGLRMALKEYDWFRKYRTVQIKKGNVVHLLSYFHVKTDFPRPESLSEDIKTFLSQNAQSEGEIFSNLKSGAESGWDFSSRWFKGEGIETIAAYSQIPVDLNALLYKNEQILSKLFEKNEMIEKARQFGDLARKRHIAINTILWNEDKKTWNDVRLDDNSFVDQKFFFSNVFPLIFDITPPNKTSNNKIAKESFSKESRNTIYTVLNTHKKELFGYKGGVPTSGEGNSDQQWDFPNVWAPHQFLIVDKLISMNEQDMALQVSRAFYNSVKAGFQQSGVFYEKYNCETLGLTGKGGEYEAQTGFGWTNGTALSFIHSFGDLLDEDYDVQNEYEKISEYLSMKVSGTER